MELCREYRPMPLSKIAWLTTVVICVVATLILLLSGYLGYAGVVFAVALAAGIKLLDVHAGAGRAGADTAATRSRGEVYDQPPGLSTSEMIMAIDQLSATFAALADPTRRAILARLAQGDATVKELAEPFPITLQAVSKHLKVL